MDNTVNLLLVEDDDIDAEAALRAFQQNKIANPIHRARDGVEAMEMLRGLNGKEKIPSPFMILTDINMPRMDGIEFIEAVRKDQSLRQAVIFVLTTSKSDEDKFRAYNFNIAGYLVKSNVGHDFMEMINMLGHYWKIVEFPSV